MTLAKISLASAAAITIISWGALAQENQNKGRITQLDHINGKITLQHAPAGTVGEVGASSLVDEYKIQDGVASKDFARRRRSGLHRSPDWRRLDDHKNSKEIIKSELFAIRASLGGTSGQ